MIVLESMERKDLLMVAIEIFPELTARGFFTVIKGMEYYFSGLQEMEIESAYKTFYEEYDVAFNVRSTYSVCDCKTESMWKRMDGNRHVYRTPMLYVINRFDMNATPAQIATRMISHYRANTLVIEKYTHPEFSASSLKIFLSANGIHMIIRKHEQVREITESESSASVGHKNISAVQARQQVMPGVMTAEHSYS